MLIYGLLTLFVALANSVQASLLEPDKTIYVLTEVLSMLLCIEVFLFLIVCEVCSLAFYTKDSLLFALTSRIIRIFACLTLISIALSINPLQSNTENPLGTTSIYQLENVKELFNTETSTQLLLTDKENAIVVNPPSFPTPNK